MRKRWLCPLVLFLSPSALPAQQYPAAAYAQQGYGGYYGAAPYAYGYQGYSPSPYGYAPNYGYGYGQPSYGYGYQPMPAAPGSTPGQGAATPPAGSSGSGEGSTETTPERVVTTEPGGPIVHEGYGLPPL